MHIVCEENLIDVLVQSEFTRLDTDRNGQINRLEFETALEDRASFMLWDDDRDGQVNVQEFSVGVMRAIEKNATYTAESKSVFAMDGQASSPTMKPLSSEVWSAGPHAVGRRSFTVITPTSRPLDTTVFYPAQAFFNQGDDVNINHVVIGAAASVMPSFLMGALRGVLNLSPTKIPAASKLNADIKSGTYPLVFFLHGDQSSHHFASTLLEGIASHGFVVVASDHPGISLESLSVWALINPPQKRATQMLQDISDLLDLLKEEKHDLVGGEFGSTFGKYVNADSYALLGHSRGGIAAFAGGSASNTNVQLAAGLMITGGWVKPSFKAYLQIGGTADSRYSAAQCRETARKVSAEDFKAMYMIEDAPHTAPAAPGVCVMLSRIPSTFHSYFQKEMQEVVQECALVEARPDLVLVIKAITTAALTAAFKVKDVQPLATMHTRFANIADHYVSAPDASVARPDALISKSFGKSLSLLILLPILIRLFA